MAIGLTVVNQVAMMFGLMAVGFVLYRTKVLSDQGSEQMAAVLVKVVTPAVIISSFNIPFNRLTLLELVVTFVLGIGAMLMGLVVAWLIYKQTHRIEQFAITFSNVGFFGIPLVIGLLGQAYVIYLSAYILAFNVLVWSIGMYLVTGRKASMKLTAFVKTPAFFSLIFGLIVFVSPFKLSGFVSQGFSVLGATNTPLAMLVLGTYLAKSPLKSMFLKSEVYRVALARLVIVPALVLAILSYLPALAYELKLVVLIASSAPSATMLAIFSQLYGDDYEYGAQLISVTNLFAMLSIPLIVSFASRLLT